MINSFKFTKFLSASGFVVALSLAMGSVYAMGGGCSSEDDEGAPARALSSAQAGSSADSGFSPTPLALPTWSEYLCLPAEEADYRRIENNRGQINMAYRLNSVAEAQNLEFHASLLRSQSERLRDTSKNPVRCDAAADILKRTQADVLNDIVNNLGMELDHNSDLPIDTSIRRLKLNKGQCEAISAAASIYHGLMLQEEQDIGIRLLNALVSGIMHEEGLVLHAELVTDQLLTFVALDLIDPLPDVKSWIARGVCKKVNKQAHLNFMARMDAARAALLEAGEIR